MQDLQFSDKESEAVCMALVLLLERREVAQALRLLQKELATHKVDELVARVVLEQAKHWHSHGFAREQRALCELVIAHYPAQAEAMHLLGFHHQALGEFEKAQHWFEQALAQDGTRTDSLLALAQLRMMRSNFAEARELYESRFAATQEPGSPDLRGLPIARWRGENLAGKKIYLWAEQGLGDMVMFAGFLPHLLAQKPARVVLGVFPRLLELFARSFPDVKVEPLENYMLHALAPTALASFEQVEKQAAQATVAFDIAPLRSAYMHAKEHGLFDYAAPIGDLLVHCLPGYIPAQHGAYLVADPARVAAYRASTDGQGRRIGMSWLTTNPFATMRSIPLEGWLPVLARKNCHFVSLQHNVTQEEIAQFCHAHGCHIEVAPGFEPLKDADGLAALMASMDEVITIDNSVAHLAGALGVKTTLLLPVGHNFRWPEMEGGKTLWYQSVRVLRQREFGKWEAVMRDAAALTDYFRE